MSTDLEFKLLQVTAGQDLTVESAKYKAITLNGTIAAAPALAAGLLRHGADSGKGVSVVYEGISKAIAGGAINTVGFPITVTTSGFVIAAASGGIAIGRALETCASGDLFQSAVDFKTLGFWHG